MLHKIVHESIAIPKSILPKRSRDGIKFQRVYGRINAFSNSCVPTTWWNDLPTEILNIIESSLFRNEISQIFN